MTPTQWLSKMKEIWLKQKPDLILDLLDDSLKYYEDPTQPPFTKKLEVVKAWQEIKTQNIEYINIEILHEDCNVAMALWKFKEYNKVEHVGAYFLKLNESGKCILFRQWWNS